jgi:hypothetical protein
MVRRSGLCCFVGVWFLLVAVEPGRGDDSPKSAAQTLASDLVALSRLVMEHHFQPPVQQQVILAAARGLYESRDQEPPRDLAQRCSAATTDSEYEAILTAACGNGFGDDAPRDALRLQAMVLQLSGVVPGDLSLESLKASTANRQLAESRYVGVGIAVRMTDDAEFQVMSAIPGGPMQVAGVPDKTIITEIDGWKTTKKRLEDCV